jgi:5-methylcytosine-specific restriction endonuclease McrA
MEKARSKPQLHHQESGRTELNRRRWEPFILHLRQKRLWKAAEQDVAPCEQCAEEGKPYAKQRIEGHHVIARSVAPQLTYDPDNIRFLCRSHHSKETARERYGQ